MPETFAHGYALLIGVGQSAWADWSLPVTVKDVEALNTVLVNPDLCGYPEPNIRLLTNSNATRQAILDNLQWLQQQAASDPEATVVVYYSGHGWLDKIHNRYYLVQHDIKPYNLPESALAADSFTDALRQIQAKRLLVAIDSCHAQGMATAKAGEDDLELPEGFVPAPPSKGLFDELAKGEGRAVFTSCLGLQKSWIRKDGTMSIYTYHLIEALQGAANQLGDTKVSVADLMKHLDRAVPESTRQEWQAVQEPWFSSETTNFPIALLHGGKGLPTEGWDAVKPPTTGTNLRLVHASGSRSVAMGGDVDQNTIVTGDRNVIGK
jgi:uncharacterized caspase-like protein